jgi:hypothetical protein
LVLAHVAIYEKTSYLSLFLPVAIILMSPLIFSLIVLAFSDRLSGRTVRWIKALDASLLPNSMPISLSGQGHIGQRQPPSIHEKATTGGDGDYFDFKSIPLAIVATFLIHFGCFAEGMHHDNLVVMAHYFLTLAAILVNTRVVAFPAIILTNVGDSTVQFNSVWPELSFV